MNILLTGSDGYIGTHLRKVSMFRFECADLKLGLDFADIKGQEFDTVIHLAANASVTESFKDPDACLNNNAFKLIPFLTNNRIGRFIFASSGGTVYGSKLNAREGDASFSHCISPYGQLKFIAEEIIRRLQPNHIILRLGNVYGGDESIREDKSAHTHFREDDPIVVYGNQTRDFINIDTVCNAIRDSALHGHIFGTFNIGTGIATSVMDVAEKFAAGRGVTLIKLPSRFGEVENNSLDITKALNVGLIND